MDDLVSSIEVPHKLVSSKLCVITTLAMKALFNRLSHMLIISSGHWTLYPCVAADLLLDPSFSSEEICCTLSSSLAGLLQNKVSFKSSDNTERGFNSSNLTTSNKDHFIKSIIFIFWHSNLLRTSVPPI